MNRCVSVTRRATILVLVIALVFGALPQSAYAASPVASPVIASTAETDTYQSVISRTGSLNSIQIDTADSGNYQINEVARLSDGYLYLGFDNATGNELVRKVDFNGTMLWQNKNFVSGDGDMRGAVEYAGRLFVVGYTPASGFICELSPSTGTLIPGSTSPISLDMYGAVTGAVTDGAGHIYISTSIGLYSYDIATKTLTPPITGYYLGSIAYVPELQGVVALNYLMDAPWNNTLIKFTAPDANGAFTSESTFHMPADTDFIWSIYYMNGYLYATGQDTAVGSYYVRKFAVNGTDLGRKFITCGIADQTNVDYHTHGMFSFAYSSYFDSANNKIYFLSTCNYPNREGKPLATGLDTGKVNTPFNTLGIVEFNATSGDISSEFVKVSELLDLNLHSVRGMHRNASGDMVLTGTTQQGNTPSDTTNRMFMLRTTLSDTTDTAPQLTAPKTIVSYTNMTTSTGLVNESNIASKMSFSDDRTANDKLAGSFKLFSSIPTGTGTGDIYFSVTDQCGNKTIGKTSLVRKKQVTGLSINGPASLPKTTSTMPTANYSVTVTPFDATDPGVTWSSSATDVATIDPATGALTAVGFGSTTITVQSVSYPAVSATLTVKVKNLYDMEITPVNDAADQAVNGNISVTFQEAMNTSAGTVLLNNVAITGSKIWSNGNKTFTIPYTGLSYNTKYTIKIMNFRDTDGNFAATNESNSFTTMPADVPNAKTAAQNATYTAIAQADVTDENSLLAYVQNIAATAINNGTVTVTVNKISYTPAVAGNSADADGTNGSYVFTVTVSKGSLSDTTGQFTLVITATQFTGVTDVNAVAAAKAALADGDVHVAFGATQQQKTEAVQAYVDGLLSAVGNAAGVLAEVSYESGNSYIVSLSKGSVTDSKTLVINIIEAADPDIAIVGAAHTAAENAAYTAVAQASVTDETVLYTYVQNIAQTAISNTDVMMTVNEVSYTQAIAGTSADEFGTDGAYVFTITVSKGSLTETTDQITLVITATAYTGVTDINAVAAAKAALTGGDVHVAFGTTQPQKTAAVQTYVNGLLSAVTNAAGVLAEVSFDSGNSYIVALSKGSVTDSKTLTMNVIEAADPDIAIVEAAQLAAENAIYAALAQPAATDEATVFSYIEDIALAAVSNTDVTVTVNKISYTQAIAGTYGNANGTNGEYVFAVTVSKGSHTLTTTQKTLTITAQKYAFLLTVEGGTGGGSFTAGTTVSITADPAPAGMVFDKWTTSSGVVFENAYSALTTFVMPVSDVTVTAAYKSSGGTGSSEEPHIPRTITNTSSGVSVSGDEIARSAQLTVTPISQQAMDTSPVSVAIREAGAEGQLIAAYDIKLRGGFSNSITLSFPVGEAYNGQAVTILHYVNGRTDTYTVQVVNGAATITVDSLSPFVILRTGIIIPDTVVTDPPKTGDAAMQVGFLLTAISVLGASVLRKRKNSQ